MQGTPYIRRIWNRLHYSFPDVGSMGIRSVRFIAGTTIWSQHSWENAWDITSPRKVLVAGPRTRFNPLHMKYMDAIYSYLNDNRAELSIRNLLWRRTNHWDHIHVDCDPRGVGTPPGAGGTLQVKYPDGRIETEWPEDMSDYILAEQKGLNAAGFTDPEGNPLAEDGVMGPNTEYAITERNKAAAFGRQGYTIAGRNLLRIRTIRNKLKKVAEVLS